MRCIVIIVCKIMHSPSSCQMFSDYLVIIQTSKDKGDTNKTATLFYVIVYEKNTPKAMVISEKSATFAVVSPIYLLHQQLTKTL